MSLNSNTPNGDHCLFRQSPNPAAQCSSRMNVEGGSGAGVGEEGGGGGGDYCIKLAVKQFIKQLQLLTYSI